MAKEDATEEDESLDNEQNREDAVENDEMDAGEAGFSQGYFQSEGAEEGTKSEKYEAAFTTRKRKKRATEEDKDDEDDDDEEFE